MVLDFPFLGSAKLMVNFLIFCRLSAVIMFMPGFYSTIIPNRIKVLFALAFVLYIGDSIISEGYLFSKIDPETLVKIQNLGSLDSFIAILSEVFIGITIGVIVLCHVSVLSTCGILVGLGTGLTNVTTSDNYSPMENTTIAQFLALCFTTIIFMTDTHLEILQMISQSYRKLPIYSFYQESDHLILSVVRIVTDSILIGIKLSMPITLVSILFAIVVGILSRIVPAFNIYYVMMPVQFLIGIIVLYFCIAELLTYALENLSMGLKSLLL